MFKVLVIDDDKVMCQILSCVVEKLGCEPVCAYTLESGLGKAAAGDYGAVLLDVQLPDGNGLDILPRIRQLSSAPEVIIMTGSGERDGAEMAIKNGAWDYIQKTDSPQSFILPLKRVIQYREELKRNKKKPVALKRNGIIGNSPAMHHCFDMLAQAAANGASVLINGETGTGKELFARAIHDNSSRSKNPFIVVDCAALPESLAETILFGHEKGAYTGASDAREGLVYAADGGTLFLDEIGELPLLTQKVFLRVLQERRFRPVGGKKEVSSDFRLIAATNQNVDKLVAENRFRDDLLYRIKTLFLNLPPLREHPKDIAGIARYHLDRICSQYDVGAKGLSPKCLEILTAYDWPGNVRELVRVMEAAVSAAGGSQILFCKHFPENIRIDVVKKEFEPSEKKKQTLQGAVPQVLQVPQVPLPTLKVYRKQGILGIEKEYLQKLLTLFKGDIEDACRISGLSRSRFYGLLKEHRLTPPPVTSRIKKTL